MSFFNTLFWISFVTLLYTYVGYGLLLFIVNVVRSFLPTSKNGNSNHYQPTVTLVVPAYNEAGCLENKIENSLQLDYPKEKLQLLFITDGSTDGSPEMLYQHETITHLHGQERLGKMAAINKAMRFVKTEVVIFSDANTILNRECVNEIVKHYANERVGGVAGEKRVHSSGKASVAFSEGIYWQYEALIKNLESKFNTVIGAAGELFSLRTSLFTPQNDNVILDDLILSLHICTKGYKLVYEPNAYASERTALNIDEEKKRKIRIAAGAYQSLWKLKDLFNIFKYPLLSFQFFSRRVLRWVGSPLALALLFITNIIIVALSPFNNSFYSNFLIFQSGFYLLALVGFILNKFNVRWFIVFTPFYFVFMNACLVAGFLRYINGKQTVLWEKAQR